MANLKNSVSLPSSGAYLVNRHNDNLVPRVSLLPFLGAFLGVGERRDSFSRSKEGKKRDPGNEVGTTKAMKWHF